MSNDERLLKEERHAAILEYLEENKKVSTAYIQRKFGVSYGTANNDLDEIAERGYAKRTHGGIIKLPQIGYNPVNGALSSKERCTEIRENYLEIARAATAMIAENDVVYLTGASLGYLIAREIPVGLHITAVVNSISIAEELRKKSDVRVIIAGGEMADSGNIYGDFALSVIERVRYDKAFITSAACTADFGLSVQGATSIPLTKAVIKNARLVIGMYPAEKVGCDSILQICRASEIDKLITEPEAPDDECEKLRQLGIEVVYAKSSKTALSDAD